MQTPKAKSSTNDVVTEKNTTEEAARTGVSRADGDYVVEAVPSNTAINNCNSLSGVVKFLRWGVDSLYLSYQGNLHPEVNQQLADLKRLAQSENPLEQAKAQISVGEHLFEVKDKGSSMFSYVIEDNAFRIQLSRPGKAVPMAYIKLSSEYLTYKTPAAAEEALYKVLSHLGVIESSANVSRIDLFVDFSSDLNMESWKRESWVTHASSVNSYAVDNHFTGWAIGLGGVMAGRLYDKLREITKSSKGYLVPLWQNAGWVIGEPIWRLEFEFKRQLLAQKGLSRLSDVLANLDGLWSYATTEWLKLTISNPEDKTRARWPIHPLWATLATVDWETEGGPLQNRFSNQRSPEDRIALNRAFSGLTTWMAAHGYRDWDIARPAFVSALVAFMNNRAMDLGLSFEGLVNEKVSIKARKFNTLNNLDDQNKDDEYWLEEAIKAYREASDGE